MIASKTTNASGKAISGTQGAWIYASTISPNGKIETIWVHPPMGQIYLGEEGPDGKQRILKAKRDLTNFAEFGAGFGSQQIVDGSQVVFAPPLPNFAENVVVYGTNNRLLIRAATPSSAFSTIIAFLPAQNIKDGAISTNPNHYRVIYTLSRGPNSEWVEG